MTGAKSMTDDAIARFHAELLVCSSVRGGIWRDWRDEEWKAILRCAERALAKPPSSATTFTERCKLSTRAGWIVPLPPSEDEVDWTPEAARLTLDNADEPPPLRSSFGTGLQHASWMLGEIIAGRVSGKKAHRWLGYAQALFVEGSYLTLDEAKLANKKASEAMRPLCGDEQ